MMNIKLYCHKNFQFFGGDDNITPAFMGLGGDGIISVASNIYPKKMTKIIQLYLKKTMKEPINSFMKFYLFVMPYLGKQIL